MQYRLGIDIGGTFTDFVLLNEDSQQLHFWKTLTTPDDPARAILNGVADLTQSAGVSPAQIHTIVHGTTLVTNAVIERRGARCALLTTAGFEDVLEIGREMRYDIYDLFMDVPQPLVSRDLRLGVRERLNAAGEILEDLDMDQLDQLLKTAVNKGVEAVAVCYLHAWYNPLHEQKTRDHIKQFYPDLYVSISSEILPEIREYERAVVTAMNAYVQPITERYLTSLERRLAQQGFNGVIHIMLSSGRLTTLAGAVAAPVHLLESGPAGGVAACSYFAESLADKDRILCFDMGGTTAKAALIHQGKPDITNRFEAGRVRRFKKGSGLPVHIPVIDMIEIGAGGGSIAAADALGLLKVGPRSAGSEPGPVAYGRGGTAPTVTDADLLLGYLNPDYFLGGTMDLDLEGAKRAMSAQLGDSLGLDHTQAAMGIHRIVNENMAGAARVHILEKGQDPRGYTMLAFGGAGPVHAFGVARLLGLGRLIIPVGAGVASALGFLVAPLADSRSRGYLKRLDRTNWSHVNQFLAEMEADGRCFLQEAGVDGALVRVQRIAEMRYCGQGHEIAVELPAGELSQASVSRIEDEFQTLYRERYQRSLDNVELETVTWRVTALGPAPAITPPRGEAQDCVAEPRAHRQICVPGQPQPVSAPVYDRYKLTPGVSLQGPAVIEEKESTLVAAGPCTIGVDRFLNLIVDMDYGDEHDK